MLCWGVLFFFPFLPFLLVEVQTLSGSISFSSAIAEGRSVSLIDSRIDFSSRSWFTSNEVKPGSVLSSTASSRYSSSIGAFDSSVEVDTIGMLCSRFLFFFPFLSLPVLSQAFSAVISSSSAMDGRCTVSLIDSGRGASNGSRLSAFSPTNDDRPGSTIVSLASLSKGVSFTAVSGSSVEAGKLAMLC